MKKLLLVSTIAIVLSGCSSTDSNSIASTSSENKPKKIKMKCEVSSMTGSKLKRKRCEDAAYAAQKRTEAKRLIRESIDNAADLSGR